MYNTKIVAKKIKDGRMYRGLTQDELAKACGIHINTVRRVEGGKVMVRSDTLGDMANVLDLMISFFYTDEMTPESADKTKQPPKDMEVVLEKIDSISNLIKFNDQFETLVHFMQTDIAFREFSVQIYNLPQRIRQRLIDRLQGTVDEVIDKLSQTTGEDKHFKIPFCGLIYEGILHNTADYFGQSTLAPIEYLKAPGEYFSIKIMDKSLEVLHIEPNTVILLKAVTEIQSGQIGIVEIDSVIYLKKVVFKNKSVDLISLTNDSLSKSYDKKKVKVLGYYVGPLNE